ncbi:MAG: hypothetical protein ACQERZ_04965 [Fusobacteriota bacterium]
MPELREKRLYCKKCKEETLCKRKDTNNWIHLILSIITLGLWIPFWIMAVIQFNAWHCSVCGARVKDETEDEKSN